MKILASIVFMLLVVGCTGPDHVSVAEFKKEHALVGQPQSMRRVTIIGVRGRKALLKVSSMPMVGGKWKDRIIYALVGELDGAILQSFLPPEPIQSPETTRGK